MTGRIELENALFKTLSQKGYPEEDIIFIRKAFDLAVLKHEGQKRASGEEYIIHPISVALYLSEMNVDREMIATGLLHDVVEDTDVTKEQVAAMFGESVANLVDGVTKISKLKTASNNERKAETIRKMLFAMILDMRVIIVKLADKIHNMSTLQFLPVEKQRRIAKETLEIYAPLAGKLGLGLIKNELENMVLKALKPNVFEQIEKYSKEKESEKLDIISQVSKKLNQKLERSNIKYSIKSRVKHYYSVYNKMKEYNKKIEDIFDLYGIRIITETVEDCYAVFGIVHSLFKPLPGRFKDYIANPKSNGYKSLHTTVMVGNRKALEIQIRTAEMDMMNEYGVAAHWLYKTGNTMSDQGEFKWLESLKKVQQDELSPEDYYQTIRNDILREEIYVFSPKGDIFELPKGATALDFAYRVHTEVGHRCRGAKANGQIIPLHSPLKNGMFVEVITAKESLPKMEWISLVKTVDAKKKIRHFFSLIEKEKKDQLQENAKKQVKSTPTDIVREHEFTPKKISDKISSKTGDKIFIEMDGERNLLFTYAKCCKPIPPNEIIGFISRGRGLIIHRADCKSITCIKDFEERKVTVNWGHQLKNRIVAYFMRTTTNNKSYIELSNVMKKHGGTIIEFRIDESTISNDIVDGYFTIELPLKTNIDNLAKELSALPSISFLDRR